MYVSMAKLGRLAHDIKFVRGLFMECQNRSGDLDDVNEHHVNEH